MKSTYIILLIILFFSGWAGCTQNTPSEPILSKIDLADIYLSEMDNITVQADIEHGIVAGVLPDRYGGIWYEDISLNRIVRSHSQTWEELYRYEKYGHGPCEFKRSGSHFMENNTLLFIDYEQMKMVRVNMSNDHCESIAIPKEMAGGSYSIISHDEGRAETSVVRMDEFGYLSTLLFSREGVTLLDKVDVYMHSSTMGTSSRFGIRAFITPTDTWIFPSLYSGTVYFEAENGTLVKMTFRNDMGVAYQASREPLDGGHARIMSIHTGTTYFKYHYILRGIIQKENNLYAIYEDRISDGCDPFCLKADVFTTDRTYLGTHVIVQPETKFYVSPLSNLGNDGCFIYADQQEGALFRQCISESKPSL